MRSPSGGPNLSTVPDSIPAPTADLCLNFANTLYWRGSAVPTEQLHKLDDLAEWGTGAGILSASRARVLRALSRDDPAAAEKLFRDAVELREAIYNIFSATGSHRPPNEHGMRLLNRALAAAPQRREIAKLASGYGWRADAATSDIAGLLAPVVWSAGDLLVGPRLAKVRRCANDQCLWLFLDDSKSGNRRWCSMSACGNRAKAHRHYQRQKEG